MTDREVDSGRFLVVDGPEGSGKSSQVHRIFDHLRNTGHAVQVFRDPGGTSAGERIRGLLLDPAMGEVVPLTEILLFLASRSQLIQEKIKPALRRGEIVVLDRFHYSTIAYQVFGLGQGTLPGSIIDLIRSVNGDLEPDRVFLLDVPPEIGMKRISGKPDRIEKRDHSFHTRVRRGFLAQAEQEPDLFRVIDATLPEEEVFQKLIQEVFSVL